MLNKNFLALYYSTVFLPCILGFGKQITLGGIFEEDDPSELAFIRSVNAVNQMRNISDDLAKVFFLTNSRIVTKDLFEVAQTTCSILEGKVAAIFGPSDKHLAEHVQSICDAMDMPNVVARMDIEPMKLKAVNLHPSIEELGKVFSLMVTEFHWKKFTILYENSDYLIFAHLLVKRFNTSGSTVTIRHLGKGPDYREVLINVRRSGDTNIVIHCSDKILHDVLDQAQQTGILSENHDVIVTNLDVCTLNLEPYQYCGVNFTGLRLVDVKNEHAINTFYDFLYDNEAFRSINQLRVAPALVYDSVQLFARAFKRFHAASTGHVRSLTCDGTDPWEIGASLNNFLRTTEVQGLTGLVKLDSGGLRTNFALDVVKLTHQGLMTVGAYHSTRGIQWKPLENVISSKAEEGLFNKTLIVLISINDPYNMLKKSAATQTGNDRYEGFTIDIIHELGKALHFNYTFIVEQDYGSKGADGKWSGMMGRIISGEADLAITDLTVTAERQKAVDFTLPFMNLGISILYRKPTRAPPSLFGFLSPFSYDIWLGLAGSCILVSLSLFIVGRMCPAEWNNPYPCIEEPEQFENQFTMKNAFWFTVGSIMQQGSEIAPSGLSTRMLASAWWFFCLIIVALYTANLAAFLVVDIPVKTLRSVHDLGRSGTIKYGAKRGGATFDFFNNSETSQLYKDMAKYMHDNDKDVMTKTNDEGVIRVLDGNQNYAFLMESSSIEYSMRRHCNLSMVGDLLVHKNYGIALRKGSKYKKDFDKELLTLGENGRLKELESKWWDNEQRGAVQCKAPGADGGTADPLSMKHVGGVFLTLGVGVIMAFLFTLWECIWGIRLTSRKEGIPFKEGFADEAKFVLKFKGTAKPREMRKISVQTTETNTRASTPPYEITTAIVTPSGVDR